MNIFIPTEDHILNAQALDDSRLGKQILENAQILSTAIHILDPRIHASACLYKPYNPNGRFVQWLASSHSAAQWLVNYSRALSDEHLYRFNKVHSSIATIILAKQHLFLFPDAPMPPFVADKLTESFMQDLAVPSIHEAYQLTLLEKWKLSRKAPAWTNRTKPNFLPKECYQLTA